MKKLRIFAMILVIAQVLTAGTFAADSWYPDVKESRWSYADIKYVSDAGYMNGVDGGKFDPSGKVTRAMVVTVLYRFDSSPDETYVQLFRDVPDGKWFTDAVIWAGQNDIVNGVGDGRFAPNDNVTREQLAAIIYRFAAYKHVNTDKKSDITGYSDYKKIHDYARDAFAWTNEAGLIKGVTDTTLNPRGTATREQFAAIIHRFDTADFEYDTYYAFPSGHSYYTEPEAALVTDADLYVAVDGDDGADGSLSHPLATFGEAVLRVRELKKTKTGGITVAFKAGEYGKLSVNFGKDDSGTEECPIRYCAYGDGPVVFCNATTLKLEDFKPISDAEKSLFGSADTSKIKKYDISKIGTLPEKLEVYSGSERCVSARYPNRVLGNDDYTQASSRADDSHMTLLPFLAKRVESYHTLDGVKLNGYLMWDWASEVLGLVSYDRNTKTLEVETPEYGIGESQKYFIFDVSEELDTEFEFFLDRKNGIFYAYDPQDDVNILKDGQFIALNGEYITVEGMEFHYSSAVSVNIGGSHNTLKRCLVNATSADEVVGVSGSYNTVTECEVCNGALTGIWFGGGDKYTLTPSHNLIDNCYIHDFGLVTKSGSSAVRCFGVGGTVSHNELCGGPHYAIALRGNLNLIEYNVIHDVVLESEDAGSIYGGRSLTDGGTVIRYNLFYNVGDTMRPFCVYLDDGLAGEEVYGNIFYGDTFTAGVIMGGGRENKIYNNVTIRPEGIGSAGMKGFFIMGKYHSMALDGEMSDTFEGLVASYSDVPSMPQIWRDTYPWLYDLDFDPTHYDDPKCVVNPTNVILRQNYTIGKDAFNDIDESVVTFGDVSENNIYAPDENPIFVCPAKGDYRIRDGADFLKIPFDEIGRY